MCNRKASDINDDFKIKFTECFVDFNCFLLGSITNSLFCGSLFLSALLRHMALWIRFIAGRFVSVALASHSAFSSLSKATAAFSKLPRAGPEGNDDQYVLTNQRQQGSC
jgi:hypothetical protein